MESFSEIRSLTEAICRPLLAEDYGVQTIPDVSPPKWHLAHTTWFFENFFLRQADSAYRPFCPDYDYLFNSYYESQGPRWERNRRGLLFRPTTDEIFNYRRHVDGQIQKMLRSASSENKKKWEPVLELGLHHEQQHQELLLTDIKFNFGSHPLKPAFKNSPAGSSRTSEISTSKEKWILFSGGIKELGYDGNGFSFDNERPRHKVWCGDYFLQERLVTNGEFAEFIDGGGYGEPRFWLSDGWARVQTEGWQAPLYWTKKDSQWRTMTLHGEKPVEYNEPVCHVSYYEAEAFARWRGKRLPTEAEWENAASLQSSKEGNFLQLDGLHPRPAALSPDGEDKSTLKQVFGDVWEWTSSSYVPYPGFKPLSGDLGEYNGKFMCNQMVLRGGSCATPSSHFRPTYRNFFPPHARWQFSGIRLAGDLEARHR